MRANAHAACVVRLLLMNTVAAADRPVYCGTERWRSLIAEAGTRFEIPQVWLHAVIRAESAGCELIDGHPITSAAGAMGLMQLMPATWNEYRERLTLGNDPYNPRDNILAGAAYLRELYDRYGSPNLLAAYHAGPKRYEAYRLGKSSLPAATLDYLHRIARNRGSRQLCRRLLRLQTHSPMAICSSALRTPISAVIARRMRRALIRLMCSRGECDDQRQERG